MPIQLKNTYVYVFTVSVIFAVYGWYIFGILGISYFTGPDALIRIGQAISTLIIGGYTFEVLTVLAVSVFNFKILKNTKNDFIVDERDKQILYKSTHVSHLVLCASLFLSMGALALGWSAFWVFHLMVLGFLLSVIAELAVKLFLYKQGV